MGYKWYFVEYTEQKWFKLFEEGMITEYFNYSFNGVSTPHLQDFLAIYELIGKGVINENDIIVKSHGDFIAGNHIKVTDTGIESKEEAIDKVIGRHTKISDKSSFPYCQIKDIYEQGRVIPKHFPEYFNWQERQAKLMINSIRVYEFFGIKSVLPFWDRENVEFWLGVTEDKRVGRNYFLKAEKHGLLIDKLLHIPYAGQIQKRSRSSKRSLKKIIPNSLINILLKVTSHKEYLNEGLNQIYTLSSKTIKDLLHPVNDFPEKTRLYFWDVLNRYPYQVNENIMTNLYTVRKIVLDKEKSGNK